ncbi:putative secreted protein [Wickerhamomyces ciferrii]|uniref:Secreted protein n=1 Tax=Wickerhamomyces ciferrii (strain ATCC 14091 / BCRC 22168 / CBS 111 / JCM 3599 / NBRC 0793 / NRRL Y-1031 F-60-10) TaxID=1206466 RepID=K0KTP6_WICCF|nr:uncharacterized protein BN7_6139 [Wickerhamomyces ciferrii]CCH46546.1 putative secreted protein [Wickerhamomyces ciferrii]
MQLATALIQGLLLSGAIALPVSEPTNYPADTIEADNTTSGNLTVEGGLDGSHEKLCFEANKSVRCAGGNVKNCVSKYTSSKIGNAKQGTSYCSFWCSKNKNINDCKTNKKKFNYHPEFACADQDYC